MCSPFFTAVFAYLMTFKREAWMTYVTLIPVVTGVIIASGGEPSFHLFGFIMCIGATAARALKSVVQGILLSSEGEKLNSMNLLLECSDFSGKSAIGMSCNLLVHVQNLHSYVSSQNSCQLEVCTISCIKQKVFSSFHRTQGCN